MLKFKQLQIKSKVFENKNMIPEIRKNQYTGWKMKSRNISENRIKG